MTASILFYLGLGLATGILSGTFGIGGGIIIVPFLYWGFASQGFNPDLLMVSAVATSLATIIPTSLSSGWAHHRRGYVDWVYALKLAPAILLGSLTGANLVPHIPVEMFKLLVALFQLGVAYTLLKPRTPDPVPREAPGHKLLLPAGFTIGALSSIVGIGGGTLNVPLLLFYGLTARHAVATSSVSGFPIALMSTLVYVGTGWNHPGLPAGNLGYVHIPAFLAIALGSISTAPLGAYLAHRLPIPLLKKGLGLLVGLVGLKLVVDIVLRHAG